MVLSPLERYRFDVSGYVVREDVLAESEVAALRGVIHQDLDAPGRAVMEQRFGWKSSLLALGRGVACPCYCCGMARKRVSTTVDEELLAEARRIREGLNDATLFDEALAALIARHRAAAYDAAYVAYDEHPLDEPDEWGDLASFRRAAGGS